MKRIIASTIFLLTLLLIVGLSTYPSFAAPPTATPNPTESIQLKAMTPQVVADGSDYVVITAYVYDAQGNPAPDGTQVNFTIGDGLNNVYTGGFAWSMDNGSFTPSPGSGTFTNVTSDGTGSTSAMYGWAPEDMAGYISTIWAYINGTNIYSTVNIYSMASNSSWTGFVANQTGAGLGGIPVTLHVMGIDSNGTPYEVYNMTAMTNNYPPFFGEFRFDNIVLPSGVNAPYGYVDTVAISADNQTLYGRSSNFSMSQPGTNVAEIVVSNTSTTTPKPTTTPTPDNGLVSELLIAICVVIIAAGGSYYLFKKK
jgi:hypothetical protein